MSEANPRESDLILGGQNPQPIDAAVLGGLAKTKESLKSESLKQRFQALNNLANYGQDGIDIAIQMLADDTDLIRKSAKKLLRDRFGIAGKNALLKLDPTAYFTTLQDWNHEIYTSNLGIVHPNITAYEITITCSSSNNECDFSELKCLVKDPNIKLLEALIIKIAWKDSTHADKNNLNNDIWWIIFNEIENVRQQLIQLKALCIEDVTSYRDKTYCLPSKLEVFCFPSKLVVFDISAILETFPNLEVLQVYGNFKMYYLIDPKLKHDKLKTLILDTTCLKRMIDSLCPIDMPELEYFEYFLNCGKRSQQGLEAIIPITSGVAAPNLKYLGLNEYSDDLIEPILDSYIIKKLAVLKFTIGAINDDTVKEIIDSLGSCDLQVLQIAYNRCSDLAFNKLQQLPFKVETTNQIKDRERRVYVL
jgi:hypothetical protein